MEQGYDKKMFIGWAGSALTKAVYEHTDMQVVGAISRIHKGEKLSRVRQFQLADTQGTIEARGADMTGSQVHSIRRPGFTLSSEIIFGLADQTLSIRHDAGTSAQPYVDGALLAIRKVDTFTGLRRGLDQVMDFD